LCRTPIRQRRIGLPADPPSGLRTPPSRAFDFRTALSDFAVAFTRVTSSRDGRPKTGA
jgi:hypothetical protein